MDDLRRRYAVTLDRARADSNVVGFILAGSRVDPDFVTEHSDFDCWVIVRTAATTTKPRWLFTRRSAGTPADTQQAMFRDVERVARGHGYGELVDGWFPDVPFLRGDVA